MKIILHIGTDKTGSTAIQHILSSNRHWFMARALFIPQTGLGQDNGHAQLLEKLDPDELKSLAKELAEASLQGCEAALLSWEGMARFNKSQIRRLLQSLPPFPIRILIYLREQAEVIQSGHLQWIKMSDSARQISAIAQPRTTLEAITAFLFLRNPRRNYYHLLKRWQKCIPKAQFSVAIFSRSTLHSSDVIADFLNQLDLSRDEEFEAGTATTNPSLDVEGALIIERLKREKKNDEEMLALADITQSVINRDGMSTKYFLDERRARAVKEHFRRSNEKLARHFMGSESYPFPETNNCWRKESLSNIQARAEQLWQHVKEIDKTPTLIGEAAGAAIPTLVDLHLGWSKPEDWGVWSTGAESVIRFRVLRRRIIGEVDSLQLTLRGHYYGKNNATAITINAIDFGEHSLSTDCPALVIPLTKLYDYEVVEIRLAHQQPISPFALEGKKDDRHLAFALMGISYRLMNGPSDRINPRD